MRLLILSTIAFIVIGGILFSITNNSNSTSSTTSFSGVRADVSSGAEFYDVRTHTEYSSGYFSPATNLPLNLLQAGQLPQVAKDTKIYVHCQSGNRSAQATKLLQDAGYTNVVDLGGVSDVQRIGGQLET